MALTTLTKEEFLNLILIRFLLVPLCNLSRWGLIRKKEGLELFTPCFWKQEGEIQVAALVYSSPRLGSAYGAQFEAYLYEKRSPSYFYAELKAYAKQNGVLELLVKPYETYQTLMVKVIQ